MGVGVKYSFIAADRDFLEVQISRCIWEVKVIKEIGGDVIGANMENLVMNA